MFGFYDYILEMSDINFCRSEMPILSKQLIFDSDISSYRYTQLFYPKTAVKVPGPQKQFYHI